MQLTKQEEAILKEEAFLKGVISEYTDAVKAPTNIIKLMGYQPTLLNIRIAYQAGGMSNEDLYLILANLANTLRGGPESFRDLKHFVSYAWPELATYTPTKIEIASKQDQVAIVKEMFKDDKPKYTGPRKKATPKPIAINADDLPAQFRHLA